MSAESSARCDCDYEFGQPVEKAIALLRTQQTNTWITLVFAILALAVSVVGMVIAPFIAIFAIGITFLWAGRMFRKLLITRASLRQLGHRKLPEAKLLKG